MKWEDMVEAQEVVEAIEAVVQEEVPADYIAVIQAIKLLVLG